jgi:hypothetical protein
MRVALLLLPSLLMHSLLLQYLVDLLVLLVMRQLLQLFVKDPPQGLMLLLLLHSLLAVNALPLTWRDRAVLLV